MSNGVKGWWNSPSSASQRRKATNSGMHHWSCSTLLTASSRPQSFMIRNSWAAGRQAVTPTVQLPTPLLPAGWYEKLPLNDSCSKVSEQVVAPSSSSFPGKLRHEDGIQRPPPALPCLALFSPPAKKTWQQQCTFSFLQLLLSQILFFLLQPQRKARPASSPTLRSNLGAVHHPSRCIILQRWPWLSALGVIFCMWKAGYHWWLHCVALQHRSLS